MDGFPGLMVGAALWTLAGGTPAPDSVVTLPPPRVRAAQTGLVRADRMEHLSLSLTLGTGAAVVTRRPAIAVGCTLALGLAKEIRDRRAGGAFDPIDLLADAVGAALAAAITRALD